MSPREVYHAQHKHTNYPIYVCKCLFSLSSNQSQDEQATDAGIPCRPEGPDGDRCTPGGGGEGGLGGQDATMELKSKSDLSMPILASENPPGNCNAILSYDDVKNVWIPVTPSNFAS